MRQTMFRLAFVCAIAATLEAACARAVACDPSLRFDAASMQRYIADWYEWFDVDGIFIDEGSKFSGNRLPDGTFDTRARDYYFQLRDYVRNNVSRSTGAVRGRGTILNASGMQRYQGIFDAADVILVSEYNCDEFFTKPFAQPEWFATIPAAKTLMVATQCPAAQLDAIVTLLGDAAHHAGHIYVTDGTQRDYGRLPPYWAEEKARVQEAGSDIVFPLFGNSPDITTATSAVPVASVIVLDFGVGCTSDYVQGRLTNDATLRSYVQAAQHAGLKVYGYVTSRFACDPSVAPYGPDCSKQADFPMLVPINVDTRVTIIPVGL